MTHLSTRRFLTLPAIHPCEAISPFALLDALIDLCHVISAYRSKSFTIHGRMLREAFREVSILLEFFQDLRNRDAAIPGNVVLAFSELHVTLQKLRHLVQDCARGGARLWVLLMSDRVSSEFRFIVRSISTALDVLPLACIDVAQEVKEFVQLLTIQTWKVVIEIDAADSRAVREIQSILTQFENGISPQPTDLKQVLDYLGIRSWSDCNEEISFLEEEFFADRDEFDRRAALLGSLIGFMAYCRAASFEFADGKQSSKKECKSQEITTLACLNPEDLLCPISLDLMMDPVTISTGHTYDRPAIQRWFKAGNVTCPVTGEKLTSMELIPNFAIQKITKDFCSYSNIIAPGPTSHSRKRDISKSQLPSSLAAAGATRMVASLLVDKLATSDGEEKNKAAYEIRLLCKSNLFNRVSMVEAGSVPWLLCLLYSSNPLTQENAVAALLNLSKHPEGRGAICEAGGLPLIVDVVKQGIKVETQQNAAAILFYLSSVEDYRREIGDLPEAIPALIELLRRGSYRGKKNALVTLFGLLLCPGNHWRILATGAIPVLANLLMSERDDLVNDSVAVLSKLAERHEGTDQILDSCVVPRMVEVLRCSTSRSGREYCVSALLALCNNGGEKVVSLLEKMPLLIPALYSLVTEGTPQAGKKARSLLNYIHRLHDQDYPAISTSLCP